MTSSNDPEPRGRGDILPDDIRQALDGQVFESLEEVNAFLATLMQQRNQASRADFQGLSPEQMHHLLISPFDSPSLATFADAPEEAPEAPMMRLLAMLLEAIGEKGLKPTTTGNLPRKIVRESALAYYGEERYLEHTKFSGFNSEPDFGDLHVTRLVAQLAGFIRKYQGRLILSQKCRTLHAKKGLPGMYQPLLRAYTTRFNWAYLSWIEELPFIQHSFLFTIYLLQRFGEQWRETAFYEDAFLRAFPKIIEEVTPRPYIDQETTLRHAYTARTLSNFAVMFGLAEMRPVGEPMEYRSEIRKLPLLDAVVRFTV